MTHHTISYLNQNHSFGKNSVTLVIYFISNDTLMNIEFNTICSWCFAEFLWPLLPKEQGRKDKGEKSWRPEWDLNPVLKCKHTLSCSEQKREKAHMRKPQSCKLQYLQNEGRFGFISLMGQTVATF